jgi:protein-S-isoprenylcysteine O-methyltransferase Ste14
MLPGRAGGHWEEAGRSMDDLLRALGWTPGPARRGLVVGLFVACTLAFLALGLAVARWTGWDPVGVHASFWGAWFAWQGWLFRSPSPGRPARPAGSAAYRVAFARHVVPGVSFGVAQMLRPVGQALLGGGPAGPSVPEVVAGLLGLQVGAVLLVSGFRAIGLARAGFVSEYLDAPPDLVRESVYRYLRHPLFVGGVLASVGVGMITGDDRAIALGLVNAAVLPVYGRIEDARLVRVFGAPYAEYRAAVGGVVPRPRAVAAALRRLVARRRGPRWRGWVRGGLGDPGA